MRLRQFGHLIGLLALTVTIWLATGCGPARTDNNVSTSMNDHAIQLTSAAFRQNDPIPSKYTCDGAGINPPLRWSGAPSVGIRGFALIMDDPDAPGGTFVHWVVWNIPAGVTSIAENSAPPGVVGNNSGHQANYYPPCPPSGQHRYVFKLFALDADLDLTAGSDREQLLAAMAGHVMASGELVGLYSRTP